MLIAYDKDGNRLFASSGVHYTECYCPVCGETLRHRQGNHNMHHFAHLPNSRCTYGKDSDGKCEWHIRMQALFSPDAIEYRFNDPETGKVKHIADVFLENSNTVIEFQHSPISDEDFLSRTNFHLLSGRRIVWIFDERKPDSFWGKLKVGPFRESDYRFIWSRPRKVLSSGPALTSKIQFSDYSVCLSIRDGDNEVMRINSWDIDSKMTTLVPQPIVISGDMNTDDFFRDGYLSLSTYYNINKMKSQIFAETARNQAGTTATRVPVQQYTRRRRRL